MSSDPFPDPFDETDRALAGGLSALAPDVVDVDVTLNAMRPRLRRAHNRARAVKIGGAVAVVALVALVATVAAPQSRRTHVQVGTPSTRQGERPSQTTTTPGPSTTVAGLTPTSPSATGSSATVAPAPRSPGATPTTAAVSSGSTPHGAGVGAGGGPVPSGGGHQSGETPTTVPQSPSETRTYRSAGGSVRVRASGGALALVSVAPSAGYTRRVADARPDDIDVRFRNDAGEWRIRVRIENGSPTSEISHS